MTALDEGIPDTDAEIELSLLSASDRLPLLARGAVVVLRVQPQ